ncbi:hypothetical protein [Streptomyces cavernicola]|uniref:PE-PGRS family protein n=1 Tax=Streptomyces cavernicola TaxID=3043613 RepID=A0ABT6S448_9ACTN|nr:hypothetical protein [Streptomyces sp. B-S-A6]MDI3402875.1 hypothetical protein [Streptomyces sp. B-S-A6]
MHRWSPLNDRQLALLGRLDAGEELSAQGPSERRSAYALRDRGLLAVRRRRGVLSAEVTDAGKFYLKHGHHPDHPGHAAEPKEPAVTEPKPRSRPAKARPEHEQQTATAPHAKPRPTKGATKPAAALYSERPIPVARRAKAARLMEQLVAEQQVIIREPDDGQVAEWRRVIDFAKRHGLVPAGKRIEKYRMCNATRYLQISLLDGPHPNSGHQQPESAPQVPVPAQLRSLHPVVAALRDDESRLAMPTEPRRRALRVFQGLAAEAVRRGHRVKEHPVQGSYRRPGYSYNGRYVPASFASREGELDLVIGDFTYSATIKQENPRSEDPERSKKLLLELGYSPSNRRSQWADRKRWSLEDVLGAVLEELETRAVEDAQRKVDEARAAEEHKARWEEAMAAAKQQAVQAQLASVLNEQAAQWKDVAVLRQYCEALERRIDEAVDVEAAEVASAREWLAWARRHIEANDPLHQLPEMPTTHEPKPDELKPYLHGWNPYGPEPHSRWGNF